MTDYLSIIPERANHEIHNTQNVLKIRFSPYAKHTVGKEIYAYQAVRLCQWAPGGDERKAEAQVHGVCWHNYRIWRIIIL